MPDLTRDPLGFILQCETNPHDRTHPATQQALDILRDEIKRQEYRTSALKAAEAQIRDRMNAAQ